MRFSYCPHCGEKLVKKEIGDEGLIPYCENCKIPLWDLFTTCVICAVVNEEGEIALIRQNYVSATNYVCIAGVMKLGESAEDCAKREVLEEIGLHVDELKFISTFPYEKKEMLMIGFKATVKKEAFHLSSEVDSVQWFNLSDATAQLRMGSIAWQLVATVANMDQHRRLQ